MGDQAGSDRSVLLVVTAHGAASRTVDLALALGRRGLGVRVRLAPGAESVVPLPVWAAVEPFLDGVVESLDERGSPMDLLVVAPAPQDLQGRLLGTDVGDPVVRAVLAHHGPTILVEPWTPATSDHPLSQAVHRDLQARCIWLAPGGADQVAGTLPAPDPTAQWICTLDGKTPQEQMLEAEPSGRSVLSGLNGPSAPTTGSAVSSQLWPHLPLPPKEFQEGPWSGRHVLITGGATQEIFDPIHVLTTRANGLLAWHLAVVALRAGARVTLILGPVAWVPGDYPGLTVRHGMTAEDLLRLAREVLAEVDAVVLADDACALRSEKPFPVPVIRSGNSVSQRLVETPDLAQALAFESAGGKPVCQIQLAPTPEGSQPDQWLVRRRLTSLARLESDVHQAPREVGKRVPALEDGFLVPGGVVQVHRLDGSQSLPSGELESLLAHLTGWDRPNP